MINGTPDPQVLTISPGDWNAEPVRHAHMLVGFFALAAEDHLLSLGSVLRGSYTPFYAGATLTRAALEAVPPIADFPQCRSSKFPR